MTTGISASPVRVTVVVPVRNAMRYLPQTVPSILAAARSTGEVEIIYVDNGSTDGSFEFLSRASEDGLRVEQCNNVSIAALRNFGARQARGRYLSFLDADCAIEPGYFEQAIAVLQQSGVAATGFEVENPPSPSWLEATWHALHAGGVDRDVQWINSGNFFISRAIFEEVGMFREDLRTGEDTELGQRLLRAGYRLRADHRVRAVHYGNPRSLREFYRRSVWHGLGMFGTFSSDEIDKPTAMMVVHLLATTAGVIVLFDRHLTWLARILIVIALQLVSPSLTVAYRAWRAHRVMNVSAILLYWLYYWARLEAAVRVLAGHDETYYK